MNKRRARLSAPPQYVWYSKAEKHNLKPIENFEYSITEFSQKTVRAHASDNMVLYVIPFLIRWFCHNTGWQLFDLVLVCTYTQKPEYRSKTNEWRCLRPHRNIVPILHCCRPHTNLWFWKWLNQFYTVHLSGNFKLELWKSEDKKATMFKSRHHRDPLNPWRALTHLSKSYPR